MIDPRELLRERFRADGDALRDRLASLAAGSRPPGPDAPTSRAMADACDDVVRLVDALDAGASATDPLAALRTLVDPLTRLSQQQAAQPAVRAVYAGALTRIRDLLGRGHG